MPRSSNKIVSNGGEYSVYECDCGYSVGSKTGMKLHAKMNHNGEVNIGEKGMVCGVCDERFENEAQRKNHLRKTKHYYNQ